MKADDMDSLRWSRMLFTYCTYFSFAFGVRSWVELFCYLTVFSIVGTSLGEARTDFAVDRVSDSATDFAVDRVSDSAL